MGNLITIKMMWCLLCLSLMVAATTAKKLNVYRKPEDRSPTFIIRDMMKIESDAIAQKRDESTPIKITLQNNQDAAYTGKLSLGGNKEEHTFFFDTGSPWLWVALDDCTSCNWPGVNPYTPDSGTNKPSSKIGNATYVDGQFATGNIATDEVRITADSEPITMNIIGVSEAHDIGNIPADGILGLAPSPAKNTDLFVTQLHKQGLIPDDMFGLEIKPNGQDSFITLGGYDTERVPDPKEIKWINLYNKDSWWTEFRHVYYGDTILSSKGGLVVFDSGTSITTMSENILYAIINGFYTKTEGQSCTIKQFQGLDLWHCPCIGNFDDIGISMNGYMAFLNSDLIIKDAGQGECAIEILPAKFEGDNDIILLGDNFFFDYYVVHDINGGKIYDEDSDTGMRIGLVGNIVENDDGAFGSVISSALAMLVMATLFLN